MTENKKHFEVEEITDLLEAMAATAFDRGESTLQDAALWAINDLASHVITESYCPAHRKFRGAALGLARYRFAFRGLDVPDFLRYIDGWGDGRLPMTRRNRRRKGLRNDNRN